MAGCGINLKLLNLQKVLKKVLIVTYYWPPAGGPGVQRWLKFVKYLRDFDIDPIVYIPENPSYPIIDESLITEVSNDVTILKHPIKEPYRFAKWLSKDTSNTISKGIISEKKKQSLVERLMLYVRGNYFIPDARKNWVKPSVKFLSDYIHENQITTVITTGPPHSIHLIGLKLKQQLNIKWLADFRDPWTTIGYHKQLKLMKSSQAKHKALESQILQQADQIIVTSSITKLEFETITNQPIEIITNGYDSEFNENVELDAKFSISHIGSFLSKRNPLILWEVLSELIDEDQLLRSELQLNLIGAVSETIIENLKSFQLDAYVNLVGYISHHEAVNYQHKSQVLLLVEIDSEDTKCIIPGKLFEYMVSKRPIIAIGPKGSDIEQIIKNTNTGKYFKYSEKAHLKETILLYFKDFKAQKLKSHPIRLEQYSRKALTQKLSELIHS